jgi:hypothetical protein
MGFRSDNCVGAVIKDILQIKNTKYIKLPPLLLSSTGKYESLN